MESDKVYNFLHILEQLHEKNVEAASGKSQGVILGMPEYQKMSDGWYDPTNRTATLCCEVKGTRYEGRTFAIEYMKAGDTVHLRRDEKNLYNSNNFMIVNQTGTNLGTLPAEVCDAVAPLYDGELLQVIEAQISYVEHITERSRYAKQAILFVEIKMKLTGEVDMPIRQNMDEFKNEERTEEKKMARAFREMMCKENINETHNNGALIPEGKPFRQIFGVMGNNTAATALTDEEIVELSKYNIGASMNGRSEYDHYYQIKFVGEFCLDNRCYAVIRPCMCVLDYEEGVTSITTAQFSVMNSIIRLITRVKQDRVKYAVVYRIESDGRKEEIRTFYDLDQLVSYIQSDKRGAGLTEIQEPEGNMDVNEAASPSQPNLDNNMTRELLEKVTQLETELKMAQDTIEATTNELNKVKEENIRLNTMVEMIRNIIR